MRHWRKRTPIAAKDRLLVRRIFGNKSEQVDRAEGAFLLTCPFVHPSLCAPFKEMDFGKDYKFYDPNYVERPNHMHLICVDCNKIVEFEDQHIELLEDCITKRLGVLLRANWARKNHF